MRPPRREVTDSPAGPRLTVGSRSHERAREILDEALHQASIAGQRGFNVARGAVCALFFLRELVFDGDKLLAGDPGTIIPAVLLGGGAVWSGLYLRWMHALSPARLMASSLFGVAMDGLLLTGIVGAVVLWPPDEYRGFLSHAWIYTVPIVVAASGLRFRRVLVWLTGAVALGGLLPLVALDRLRWPGRVTYGLSDVVFVVMLIGSAVLVALVYQRRAYALAARVARRSFDAAHARERLGRYLGGVVAQEALAAEEIRLGGTKQELAVLFSDLRGFTSAAEVLPPEVLVDQLNAYLDEMVRCIEAEGGVIDKYTGDGVMAVFGAPHARPDDAARAIAAARRMQRALARHNVDRAARGLPPLEHGIGAHFGTAVAGHIGTADHAQYTVVGDVVNVAARIEQKTKEHARPVLLSGELVARARQTGPVSDVEALGPVEIRGRLQPIELFSLASATELSSLAPATELSSLAPTS